MTWGILFDLDGTLLDSLQDLRSAVNHTLAENGYPQRSLDEIRQFVGNGAARLIRLSLPEDTGEDTAAKLLAQFQKYYALHSRENTRPYDGICEVLAALSEKYPMAVVSNKPDPVVKQLCRECFGDIYSLGESDACPRKPAPDMLLHAMAKIGVDRCVYVGDSEVDVLTAKNTGVPCLSVLWGFRDRVRLVNAGAQHFCAAPAQLPQMLEEIIHGK